MGHPGNEQPRERLTWAWSGMTSRDLI